MYQFSDELPTMSNEARRIARKWDELPEAMRKWLVETIDGTPPADQKSKRKPKARKPKP